MDETAQRTTKKNLAERARDFSFWWWIVRRDYPSSAKYPKGHDGDASYENATHLLATTVHQTYLDAIVSRDASARLFLEWYGTASIDAIQCPRQRSKFAPLLAWQGMISGDQSDVDWNILVGARCIILSLDLIGHHPWRQNPSEALRHVIRNAITQNTFFWYALRPYLVGGSALASIFGMDEYVKEAPHEQPLAQLERHLLLRPPTNYSTGSVRDFMLNGHTFEGLGRELFEAISGLKVMEFGTGIASYCHTFSHSPDGLVVGEKDTTTFSSMPPTAMIEIKVHTKLWRPYMTIPPIYMAQCIQGMIIHRVERCYFISLVYNPTHAQGDYGEITIEELKVSQTLRRAFKATLKEYNRSLSTRTPTLSPTFEALRNTCASLMLDSPSELKRRLFYTNKLTGLRDPVMRTRVRLSTLLGQERAAFWKRQPYWKEGDLDARDAHKVKQGVEEALSTMRNKHTFLHYNTSNIPPSSSSTTSLCV